ncbi:hypothetical protein CK203_117334 [Vitis vinifera]|uniref:Uncharacterized protein n=1 Tax=Vitis vinifera TaxID=29760 RepID=A0A438C829_VITVI|nr:hypothetical protein CK203_117334 [Vitis vinifera]
MHRYLLCQKDNRIFPRRSSLLESALSGLASSDASTISRVISGFSSKISLKKDSPYRR